MNLISAFVLAPSESFTVPPKNGVLEWHMGEEIHFLLSIAVLQLTYLDVEYNSNYSNCTWQDTGICTEALLCIKKCLMEYT